MGMLSKVANYCMDNAELVHYALIPLIIIVG